MLRENKSTQIILIGLLRVTIGHLRYRECITWAGEKGVAA